MPTTETLLVDIADGVAVVTLNRPEVMNSFNALMRAELTALWAALRTDDEVRCILVTGAGDRAFCTGIDRTEAMAEIDTESDGLDGYVTPFMFDDPGKAMCPKANDLWKPVVAAVNGIACGGAFYLLVLAAESGRFT